MLTSLTVHVHTLSPPPPAAAAALLAVCFQRASGFRPLNCPATCPRGRALQACVEECTASMDDKAHLTYVAFFGDVIK